MDGFRAVLARYWSSGLVPVGYSVEQEARLTANLREVVVEWRHRESARGVHLNRVRPSLLVSCHGWSSRRGSSRADLLRRGRNPSVSEKCPPGRRVG